jgi:hypothetical protein
MTCLTHSNSHYPSQPLATSGANSVRIVSAEAGTGVNATISLVPSGQIDFGGFAAFVAVIQSVSIQ